MVDQRCPKCASRVPADAEWCSLCYTSLRVQPAPAVALRPEPAFAAGQAGAYDPLFSPLAPDASAAPEAVPTEQPGATVPRAATWPCRQCQSSVAIELDACPVCGGAFLTDTDVDLRLPIVGSTRNMTTAHKAWIMIGGSFVIIAVFLVIAFVIGLVT